MSTSLPAESSLLAELQARVRRSEDLEALRQLKVQYAQCADALWRAENAAPAQKMLALFTEDAIVDLGPFGRYSGHEILLEAFHHVLPTSTNWSKHHIV